MALTIKQWLLDRGEYPAAKSEFIEKVLFRILSMYSRLALDDSQVAVASVAFALRLWSEYEQITL